MNVKLILKFHPFSMVGMDFFGPISPHCQVTGYRYVLIVVDYFSRFVWAKGCKAVTQEAVYLYWIIELAPVFEFPRCLYNDNGSHFTGDEITALFINHGTVQITALINHPSSVGLVERNVQLVISQIRLWVRQKGPQARTMWGRAIPEIMPAINGRLMRLHGFTPAEILLGFIPEWRQTHREHEEGDGNAGGGADEALTTQWVELRQENRAAATRRMAATHTRTEEKQRSKWTKPQEGDLVLVRDHQRDKDKGRKLDPRWLGPRLLTSIAESGVAGYVQELYGDKVKRYHLDDLKIYCAREEGMGNQTFVARTAMALIGFPGQRAHNLGSLFF